MVVKELVAQVCWNAAVVEVLLLMWVHMWMTLLLHKMGMKKVRKWHSNWPHRAVFSSALMMKWSAELLRIGLPRAADALKRRLGFQLMLPEEERLMLILLYSLLHYLRVLLLDVVLLDFALQLVSWNDSSSLLSPNIELIRRSFIFSTLFRLPARISPRNGTRSYVEVWNIPATAIVKHHICISLLRAATGTVWRPSMRRWTLMR